MFDFSPSNAVVDFMSESPHHGFQGDRKVPPSEPKIPGSLTIAFCQQSGSRGARIATLVGEQLGWQVYTHELLAYGSQDQQFCEEVFESLSPGSREWVEDELRRSPLADKLETSASTVSLARIILALGAQGDVILIGRGAGYLLPRRTTLHVRTVAPIADRVGYMSEWLRLTKEEAAEQIQARDLRREGFIETQFGVTPHDAHLFDLVINTSSIGEEMCAELVVQAAQGKLNSMLTPPEEKTLADSGFIA
ncbi:MAG: AAA family ATPase [Gemmataceae bacterium]